ncbi:MAG: L,D-transpeptidase family protein [Methylomicrobium sp.]|nr:L,D-transpeptidase family protein [Methylomicrobium sp.]
MHINQFKQFISARPVPLFLIFCSIALSGCQTIAPLPEEEEEWQFIPRHEFTIAGEQAMIGLLAQSEVLPDESLPIIAREFGLGFDEITRANPDLDPWIPKPAATVNLPLRFILPDAPKQGVVLNIAAKRLFYFPGKAAAKVLTYPVGIGREGWETPTGKTKIVSKKARPSWTVPESVLKEHAKKGDKLPKVVPAGENNPLGLYALRLGFDGYLIHGTNKPYGVGMEVSHGCVRLYPEDVEQLFNQTSVGTPVRVVDQPFLTAWDNNDLFLQAYQPVHKSQSATKKLLKALMTRLQGIESQSGRAINWDKVDKALQRLDGVPVAILAEAQPDKGFSDSIKAKRVAAFSVKPVQEPSSPGAWRLLVAWFNDPEHARRLASMLNHQGPPIPSSAVYSEQGYPVVAGPFNSKAEARQAAKRIAMDFELVAELIKPDEDLNATDKQVKMSGSRKWDI